MKKSIKIGLGFGVTSGVITTLGTMVGLYSGTYYEPAIIGGILMIAIADSFSDALGIHISRELDKECSAKEVWESTFTTFISKFFVAITFIVPVLILPLNIAILIGIFWGLILLTVFSYYISKLRKANPFHVISEHILIAIVVIFFAQIAGYWINKFFI